MHMHDVSDIQPTHTPTQATHQTVKESPQYKRPLAYIPVISPNNFTDLKISPSRVRKEENKGEHSTDGTGDENLVCHFGETQKGW